MKNKTSKVIATVALLAIVLGFLGTSLLVIFSSPTSSNNEGISIDELESLIEGSSEVK